MAFMIAALLSYLPKQSCVLTHFTILLPRRSFFRKWTLFINDDGTSSAIDGNAHPARYALGGSCYTDDCRKAILTSHDSTVRHGPAHLHHQTCCGEKQRCPAGIGGRRDQYFTR